MGILYQTMVPAQLRATLPVSLLATALLGSQLSACSAPAIRTGASPQVARDAELATLRSRLRETNLQSPGGPDAATAVDLEVLAIGWLEDGHPRDAAVALAQSAVLHRLAEIGAQVQRRRIFDELQDGDQRPHQRRQLLMQNSELDRIANVHATCLHDTFVAARASRDLAIGQSSEQMGLLGLVGLRFGREPRLGNSTLPAFADPGLAASIATALQTAATQKRDKRLRQIGIVGLAAMADSKRVAAAMRATEGSEVEIALLEAALICGSSMTTELRSILTNAEIAGARLHAALALALLAPQDNLALLEEVSRKDASISVRVAASLAPGLVGLAQTTSLLEQARTSEQWSDRRVATLVTCLMPESQARTTSLVTALDDEDTRVRALACTGLTTTSTSDPEVVTALIRCALASDAPVQIAAARALASRLSEARHSLRALLSQADALGQELVVEVTGRARDRELASLVARKLVTGQLADETAPTALVALGRALAADDPSRAALTRTAARMVEEGTNAQRRCAAVFLSESQASDEDELLHVMLRSRGEEAPYAAIALAARSDTAAVNLIDTLLASGHTPDVLKMTELLVLLRRPELDTSLKRLQRYRDPDYHPTDKFVGWAARRALTRLHLSAMAQAAANAR